MHHAQSVIPALPLANSLWENLRGPLGALLCAVLFGALVAGIVFVARGAGALQTPMGPRLRARSPHEEWLLVLGAMYSEGIYGILERRMDPGQFTWLDHGQCTPGERAAWRRALRRDWGIGSTASCLEQVHWLVTQGHRVEWEALARLMGEQGVLRADDATLRRFAQGVRHRLPWRDAVSELARKCALIRDVGPTLGRAGIAAWDYARVAHVVVTSHIAGYLSPEQSLDALKAVETPVRATFASWRDYARSWAAGRTFWSPAPRQPEGFLAAIDRLLTDPQSPWVRVPFQSASPGGAGSLPG